MFSTQNRIPVRLVPLGLSFTVLVITALGCLLTTAMIHDTILQRTRDTTDDALTSSYNVASTNIDLINHKLMTTIIKSTTSFVNNLLNSVTMMALRYRDVAAAALKKKMPDGTRYGDSMEFLQEIKPYLMNEVEHGYITRVGVTSPTNKALFVLKAPWAGLMDAGVPGWDAVMEIWQNGSRYGDLPNTHGQDPTDLFASMCTLTSDAECDTTFVLNATLSKNGLSAHIELPFPQYPGGINFQSVAGQWAQVNKDRVGSVLWTPIQDSEVVITVMVVALIPRPDDDPTAITGGAGAGLDLYLFSEYLRSLTEPLSGQRVFIVVEEDVVNWYPVIPVKPTVGNIVAASHGVTSHFEIKQEKYTSTVTVASAGRLNATESDDGIISGAAAWVTQSFPKAFLDLKEGETYSFRVLNPLWSGQFGSKYLLRASHLRQPGLSWCIMVLIPWTSVLGPIEESNDKSIEHVSSLKTEMDDFRSQTLLALYLSIAVFCLIILVSVYFATAVLLEPLHELCDDMATVAIMRFDSIRCTGPTSRLTEVASMQNSFLQMSRNLMEFKAFLPPAVLDIPGEIISPVVPQSPVLVTTVVDMESHPSTPSSSVKSTSFSEEPRLRSLHGGFRSFNGTLLLIDFHLPQHKLEAMGNDKGFHTLQQVVSGCLKIIEANEGVVLNFQSTQIVVGWNTFRPTPTPEALACRAAQVIVSQKFPLEPVVALVSGVTLVGFLGSEKVKSPVVYCTEIRRLRPLVTLARLTKSPSIVTETVARKVVGRHKLFPVDCVASEMSSASSEYVYALFPAMTDQVGDLDSAVERYGVAFKNFHLRNYAGALQEFVLLSQSSDKLPEPLRLQVVRLTKLCNWYENNSSTLATASPTSTYKRQYIDMWDDLEVLSAETPLPAGFKDLVRSAQGTEEDEADDLGDENHKISTYHPENSSRTLHELVQQVKDGSLEAGEGANDFPTQLQRITSVDGTKYFMSSKILGKGNTSTVFLGMQENGSLVALKRITRDITSYIDGDNKILDEINVLSTLRHDNIVAYLGVALHQGSHLVIVTELVSSGTLHSVLQAFGAFPQTSARMYIRDCLQGLTYLHANGIVHRDVKPQNVMLMVDGQCKLTDFGAAAKVGHTATANTSGADLAGTPMYMAPEAAAGNAIKASDIWGIGIMTIELLTGRLPWTSQQKYGHVSGSIEIFHLRDFLTRLANDGSMVPIVPQDFAPAVRDFCTQCLQRDPAKRPSAKELLGHIFLCYEN